jgi:hypothetical protein
LIASNDLNTPSPEEAKIKAIQYLKRKIKYLALELTDPIERNA